MDKDDTKKVVKKSTRTKKDTSKKINELNETVKKTVKSDIDNVVKEIKETAIKEVEDLTNKQKCKFCNKYFDKGMTICPNCRRRNKRSSGDFIFFAVLAIVFLFCILIFYFIDTKVINKETYESYTQKCVLVSYEDLVRVPKKYLYSDVTLVGKVVEVTGTNDGLYNSMNIVLDLNLFEDGYESLVNVEFNDNSFEKGFINGDIVKVYGEYSIINGNRPTIQAKYVNLNN